MADLEAASWGVADLEVGDAGAGWQVVDKKEAKLVAELEAAAMEGG